METYHIDQLEQMTGIKAHTIRIWEKRYGLITPGRTTTNRRYYTDEQVRKLLNVNTLLHRGEKISKIAAYSDEEIAEKVHATTNQDLKDTVYNGYVMDLIKSMLEFDEWGFEKIFSAVVLRMGMQETMLQVVYPFLNKVGVLWSVNRTMPIQEHFVSNMVKRKLMAATDGLKPPNKTDKKFLLFLPPGEWHELGLLFADHIIRAAGYQTVYLGQDVPVVNIDKIVAMTKPTHLLTFYVMNRPKIEVTKQIKEFSKINASVHVLVAGNKEILPDTSSKNANITYLSDVTSLIAML